MRRTIITLLAAATMAIGLSACGQRIKFDEAAVEVVEVGADAGVKEAEISTGRYWAPPFSYRYIVKFPTTIQTYKWEDLDPNKAECFSWITADKVGVSQCLSMTVRIDPAQADNIVRKWKGSITRGGGEDGYVLDDVVRGPIEREIKQAFITNGVKYTSAQLYADGGRALMNDVRATVGPKFSVDGIMILDILANEAPELPADIVASIQGALKAQTDTTRANAELARTVAEGNKQRAQADADAYALSTRGRAIRENPEVLKELEIKRSRGICPVGARVCVVGSDAGTIVGSEE